MRRALGLKKKKVTDWRCPKCGKQYRELYVQSSEMPYLMCKDGCTDFFTIGGVNVTDKVYPDGKPWGDA